jgi:hypothetical protein
MDAETARIGREIDAQIEKLVSAEGVGYVIFIKPNDAESDHLVNFVRGNNLKVEIHDISTETGFVAMDQYSLLECDVPCVCSAEDDSTIYEGCPKRVRSLEGR